MASSGTYTFGNQQTEQIIRDAYERIGVNPSTITEQQIDTAQRSLNYVLSSWPNRGLNLWTVQFNMLALITNQSTYTLPANTNSVLEVTLRTSNRNLGGTAFSSAGGTAQNAFSGNPNLACTQIFPDGYISYTWPTNVSYATAMVGVQSNATLTYTLVFEYSNDNGVTWIEAGAAPAQSFPRGQNIWFVIQAPVMANAFRVRETDGATLNIQELYFNTALNDTLMTPVAMQEYMAYPNKNQTGQPTCYVVDRLISPTLIVWPVPTAQFTAVFFRSESMMQDIGTMRNSAPVPVRFMEPLTAGLAHALAIKTPELPVEKIQILKNNYEQEVTNAMGKDVEKFVPLRIYGDYTQGWGSSP